MSSIKRFLIGSPMTSAQLHEEKITKKKALAVYSSDALSSVAYATEEILLSLTLAGTALLYYTLPIAIAICILLTVVTVSYHQIIANFKSGGGAYVVARYHLPLPFSLAAASALMVDYILTVAVSVSSGVAALIAAFPNLAHYKVLLAIIFVLIVMILNLRGIQESATIFAYPTYLFIGSTILIILVGFYRLATEGWVGYSQATGDFKDITTNSWVLVFIVLRAFSSGCSAMSGVEAISNGIPNFKEPSQKNANTTMIWMATLLGIMFLGISILANGFGVLPAENTTVLAQITSHVAGKGILYFWMQICTMLILILAANTAFAGFPLLCSRIASDGFLPRNFTQRGDRLVFSNGIVFLSATSIILIIIFRASVHMLIPLYAVGVFLSFTIGQLGMVRKLRAEGGSKSTILVLQIGTVVTGVVTIITAVAKFVHGAWLVIIVIPALMYLFNQIKNHYLNVASQLSTGMVAEKEILPAHVKVIIPVASITQLALKSIAYANNISNDITIVSVIYDENQRSKIQEKYEKYCDPSIKLEFLESPYRSLLAPLYDYINTIEKSNETRIINVIVPQFITVKWWQFFLHNQTAFWLRLVLLRKKDVILTTIPYHVK